MTQHAACPLIAVAMDSEAEPFRAGVTEWSPPHRLGSFTLEFFTRPGMKYALLRTGIGVANAAGALGAVLSNYDFPVVFSAGSAGGLGQNIQIGDVVAGTEYRYHNADASAFGYEPGQIPQMPAFFPGSTTLLRALKTGMETSKEQGFTLWESPIVSGDTFVTGTNIAQVRANFASARATDMESCALAQISQIFSRRFLSVRAISDLADPAAAKDHADTITAVAHRSAALVMAALPALDQI